MSEANGARLLIEKIILWIAVVAIGGVVSLSTYHINALDEATRKNRDLIQQVDKDQANIEKEQALLKGEILIELRYIRDDIKYLKKKSGDAI